MALPIEWQQRLNALDAQKQQVPIKVSTIPSSIPSAWQERLNQIDASRSPVQPVLPPAQEPGFLSKAGEFVKNVVKEGIYRPLATTAITAIAPAQDVYNLARGRTEEISRTASGYNIPGLGQVLPVGSKVLEDGGYGQEVRRMIGTGVNVGSLIVGGAGKEFGRGLIMQGAGRISPKLIAPAAKVITAGRGILPRALESVAIGETMQLGSNIEKEKPLTSGMLGTGLVSAALPVAGTGLSVAKEKAAQATAPRLINSLIKPLSKQFSYGKNPGRGVAAEGITANTFEELEPKIMARRQEIGAAKQSLLNAPEYASRTIKDASVVLSPIDKAFEKAAENPRTNSTLLSRLDDIKKDLLNVRNADGTYSPRNFQNMTPAELDLFKQKVGDLTKWTGNATDDQVVNKALKEVYGSAKDLIEQKVPSVKPLNERYGDLLSAEVATRYRDKIIQRQNLVSLPVRLGGYGIGAATLFAAGSGNLLPLIGGVGVAGLDAALSSTAVKTRLASWLAKEPILEVLAKMDAQPVAVRNGIIRIFGDDTKLRDKIQTLEKLAKEQVTAERQQRADAAARQFQSDLRRKVEQKLLPEGRGNALITPPPKPVTIMDKQVLPKTTGIPKTTTLPKAEMSISSDLISEARKYKTSEEFVKAQFNKKTEYAMSHRPSWEGMPPAYNLLEGDQLPRDVYEHPDWSIASGRVKNGDRAANESWNALLKIRNKPEAIITVYRASPRNELNIGDWITLSKTYAKGEREGSEVIHSFKIKAKDIVFAGDDVNEFGYYPKFQLTNIWNKANATKKSTLPKKKKVD